MPRRGEFRKGQALGNDYIVVIQSEFGVELRPAAVSWLCTRSVGLGADGLIEVTGSPASSGPTAVNVFNADGSLAEVSANGLRIAAVALGLDKARFVTGEREYAVDVADGRVSIALPAGRVGTAPRTVTAAGLEVSVTEVDVGNPHLVVTAGEVDGARWPAVAQALERHPEWPDGSNVERVRRLTLDWIAIQIHERGVGPTLASGTGALAAFLAARTTGLIAADAGGVEMAGGSVDVELGSEELKLSSPVWIVYTGQLTEEALTHLAALK